MNDIKQLQSAHAQCGRLEWIGLCTERRGPVDVVTSAEIRIGTGLAGDHHAQSGKSKRQVTLIQQEHLPVVAALLGKERVAPEEVRRNLVVSGINLAALKDQSFRIGDVVLAGTGPCVPCSYMEWVFGPGGYNAMRGHGGITARVIQPGIIKVGDRIELLSEPPDEISSGPTQQKLFAD